MTKLATRIRRELPIEIEHRQLTIELHGRFIKMRLKGARETYPIDYESIFDLARKRDFERKRQAAQQERVA
jgi:hypothetical protein